MRAAKHVLTVAAFVCALAAARPALAVTIPDAGVAVTDSRQQRARDVRVLRSRQQRPDGRALPERRLQRHHLLRRRLGGRRRPVRVHHPGHLGDARASDLLRGHDEPPAEPGLRSSNHRGGRGRHRRRARLRRRPRRPRASARRIPAPAGVGQHRRRVGRPLREQRLLIHHHHVPVRRPLRPRHRRRTRRRRTRGDRRDAVVRARRDLGRPAPLRQPGVHEPRGGPARRLVGPRRDELHGAVVPGARHRPRRPGDTRGRPSRPDRRSADAAGVPRAVRLRHLRVRDNDADPANRLRAAGGGRRLRQPRPAGGPPPGRGLPPPRSRLPHRHPPVPVAGDRQRKPAAHRLGVRRRHRGHPSGRDLRARRRHLRRQRDRGRQQQPSALVRSPARARHDRAADHVLPHAGRHRPRRCRLRRRLRARSPSRQARPRRRSRSR